MKTRRNTLVRRALALGLLAVTGLALFSQATHAGPFDLIDQAGGLLGGKKNRGPNIDPGKIFDAGKSLLGAFEEFTPEQEYYLGRTVSAEVLVKSPVDNDPAATLYLNQIGQLLASASDMPETFNGYRFAIVDSPEVNAISTPGGMVFVTRSLLKICRTEDEIAAILAHEIGHVQYRHGVKAIKDGRFNNFLKSGASVALSQAKIGELANTMGDAAAEAVTTASKHGYSQDLERQADAAALEIMKRVGYNPRAMVSMLTSLSSRVAQAKKDKTELVATHPEVAARIETANKALKKDPNPAPDPARQARFDTAMAALLK
jgi:predicted Zn-dependent protease